MAEPLGREPSRADVLGRLRRERWFAADAGETARVAELDREISNLSAANSATPPNRETAAARPPADTTARPRTPRGDHRVRTAR